MDVVAGCRRQCQEIAETGDRVLTTETIVLGAGIVGVCVALHLQERGHQVLLIDRNEPGEGASFGNAGLIERSSVLPYAIPRDLPTLLKYASNRSAAVRYDPVFLGRIVPWLMRYWNASQPRRLKEISRELLPLLEVCLDEHDRLVRSAGLTHLLQRKGWIEVVRSEHMLAEAAGRSAELGKHYGLKSDVLDRQRLIALEPSLRAAAVGGIHWRDPFTITDPGALTKGYAAYFKRSGGSVLHETIESIASVSGGFQVVTSSARHSAQNVVVALGANSASLLAALGYRVPLVGKRGYHLHFRPPAGCVLNHAVLDEEVGYVLAPMTAGIRLTTGVELASPSAPINRIQLDRAMHSAAQLFPLGAPVEGTPWLGLRPATPDMKPVIGPAPNHGGLWLAFGHAHHGLTLGPATGRLLAEMMSGETPFADPAPFDLRRLL